jgi:hypothetical protein
MPLLRIVGGLGVLCAIYNIVLDYPWSLASLFRWAVPVILVLSCLCVQPERRPCTFLNRLGSIAHLLLVFLILPLALLAIVTHWLHA